MKLLFTADHFTTSDVYRKMTIGSVYFEANKRSFIFVVLENADIILPSLCSLKRTISGGLKGKLCSGAVWKMMESDKVSEELEADKSSSTEGSYYFVSLFGCLRFSLICLVQVAPTATLNSSQHLQIVFFPGLKASDHY